MRRALSYLTLVYLIFLLLLGISGLFDGIISRIVYFLAFLLPAAVAFLLKERLETPACPLPLKLSGGSAAALLPLIAPTLALVFFVSWLTSLLLSFIGDGSVTDVSGNIITVILMHAVLTALLEELLFRYVPLAFLSPISKNGAVLISAMFFAFAHCNLYQIPYALLAGVIFAAIDLIFHSIWPSVLIHFLNNLISILWIRNSENTTFVTVYIILLVSLALISVLVIILKRTFYKEKLQSIWVEENKFVLTIEPILFFVMTIVIAAFNI